MRFVEKRVHLAGASVEAAIRAVYGDDTVRRVYGAETGIGPWSSRGQPRRRLQLRLDKPAGIEIAIRSDGPTVGATLTQRVVRDQPLSLHEVRSSIRLNVLGAELIKIRPRTVLRLSPDPADPEGPGVEVHMTVEMHAVLPPPLNRVVEEVMARQAQVELDRYADAVLDALPVPATDGAPRRRSVT